MFLGAQFARVRYNNGSRPVLLQRGWDHISAAFIQIAKASLCLGYTSKLWGESTSIFLPKPGKTDYYDCKSYRTITLAQVPLKLMERLILWQLEADLGIKVNEKQYGFCRGQSTVTALHKFVAKLEVTLAGGRLALGTFLDIEDAFDNVSFDAIDRALSKKYPSNMVRRWILSMITNRKTLITLNDTTREFSIARGCLQEGFCLSFCGIW